ncbi:MAG: alkaline phosphatase family protein [Clostridia bacterium]
MEKKVVLILVDGMRPDGMLQCGNPFVSELLAQSSYALDAQTVMPSVTLPCHMSLFHSVDPQRHGIVSNTYIPQMRPINGLLEQLSLAKKKTCFFYTWEELRDLGRFDVLNESVFINQHRSPDTDTQITERAIAYLDAEKPHFMFRDLGETDEVGGHNVGWMSAQYMKSVSKAMDCVQRVLTHLTDEYTLILVADHGGHDRMHGQDIPEDMTIPVVFYSKDCQRKQLSDVNIKDLAPTITHIVGAQPAKEWEGRILDY